MPDLADLFPGFSSEWINTRSGRIFARVGGKGSPLLLLHGFSETHVMWHRVAPQLADKFTLIIADLPGYGWSDMPESDKDHIPYTKRAMAKTMIVRCDMPRSRRVRCRCRSCRSCASLAPARSAIVSLAIQHPLCGPTPGGREGGIHFT